MNATRISSGILAGILAALLMVLMSWAGTASASQPIRYATPQAALEQGLGAYKAGNYEIAIPALNEAVAKGSEAARFFAQFYLARIHSDNAGALADHAKAYMLFRKIADENADIDPDDNQRAAFVAKALIALAGYARTGVKEIGLAPNPRRAVDYLNHAATYFGDKDAQFELAKLYLNGDGTSDDVRRGVHYLSVLTEESYPAAQALLAELLWRGRFVKQDEQRALALITMAVENAPAHERIWIEETYQSIFCSTTQGTRQRADGIVARWRKMFARPPAEPADRMGLGGSHLLLPERQCGNGEVIAVRRASERGAAGVTRPAAGPVPGPVEVMKGNTAALGSRDAGAVETGSVKK